MAPQQTDDSAELRLELERVLQSRVFERALRAQRFLHYMVQAALADPPVALKEYTVAIDVFDRDTTYDPSVDATVRVEASRLRSRLREYYDEEGRNDPWIIEVPKGRYSIIFKPGAPAAPLSASGLVTDVTNPPAPSEFPESGVRPPASTAQSPSTSRFRVGALVLFAVLVIGIAAAWQFRPTSRQIVAPGQPVSLAILPIENRTGDPNLDYVADGLTDDLIRQLSPVPALRLMARTTMFRYRGRSADATAIAKALRVNAVMTGELRRTPEHTSLAVEVSNVADGSVVLNREYIAGPGDLPALQSELQRDLLAKLQLESSALDPGRVLPSVTASPAAYQEFLKGDGLARSPAPAAMHSAISHFEKAVALDPQFDLAWSSLANEHVYLGTFFEPPREHMPLARKYAERALLINPTQGEAHGTLGLIHITYDWDLPAAAAEMSTASAEAAAVNTLACTAHLIERSGKPRSAEEMLSRMITYDPQSSALIAEQGCVNFYRGEYTAALHYCRDAMQMDPQTPFPYWCMGKSFNAQGKYSEALKIMRSFKERNGIEPPLLTAEIGYALGASGQHAQALEIIRYLSANHGPGYIDPYFVSIVFLSMNNRDVAFKWLNTALDVRSAFSISILNEPKWRPVRTDPRFAKIVQRLRNEKA